MTEIKTYYIEIGGSKAYFRYDRDRQTAHMKDRSCTISEVKFNDFLLTARELGLKSGELLARHT